MTRRAVAIATFLVIASAGARAQQPAPSLADVARQAEAAKPTIRKATKTYSNASLGDAPREESVTSAPAPTAPAGFTSRSLGKVVSAEEMVSLSEQKVESDKVTQESEQTWRMRASTLRKQIDGIQARIAQLTVPNPLTDASPALKKSHDLDVANARAALDGLRKQWAGLEVAAGEARVSSTWLDPRPRFQ